MQRSVTSSAQDQILLEYTSPHGPLVTHLRGTVLASTQQNLKDLGLYDRYMDALTQEDRTRMSSLIASSWVDIEFATQHYMLIGRLREETGMGDDEVDQIATRIVTRATDTFIGSMVRATRTAGVEAFALVMSKNDRLWDRFYMGGGCTIIQHGPKELTLENHGNPLFFLPMFRIGYDAYTRVLTRLFCKSAVIKNVRPRGAQPHTLATRFSWV